MDKLSTTIYNLHYHFPFSIRTRFTRISDLVFQVDSIEGLVAKMQANPQDAVLQRHSARSLYDLCVGKDAAAMKRKQQAAEEGDGTR